MKTIINRSYGKIVGVFAGDESITSLNAGDRADYHFSVRGRSEVCVRTEYEVRRETYVSGNQVRSYPIMGVRSEWQDGEIPSEILGEMQAALIAAMQKDQADLIKTKSRPVDQYGNWADEM